MRAAVLLLALGTGRLASAEPCAAERASLRRDAERAARWNLGWRLGLTAAAIGELSVAITPLVDRDTRRSAWVGAGAATLGAAGIWLMPLRVAEPGTATCDRVDAEARRVAREQRAKFWQLQLGNLVVNATSAIVTGELTTWPRAGIGFALGYSVGLLQIYTLPSETWRRHPWHAAVLPTGHGWLVTVGRMY